MLIFIQFCGRTTSHCLYGCQSGPCLNQTGLAPFDPVAADEHPKPGEFKVVGQSGVPAMAAGLMPNGRVFFLDKVENYTQLQLDNGQYAYSAEYNPITNEVVALPYKVCCIPSFTVSTRTNFLVDECILFRGCFSC